MNLSRCEIFNKSAPPTRQHGRHQRGPRSTGPVLYRLRVSEKRRSSSLELISNYHRHLNGTELLPYYTYHYIIDVCGGGGGRVTRYTHKQPDDISLKKKKKSIGRRQWNQNDNHTYIYKYIYTCEYNMGIKCIITYCIDEAYTRLAVMARQNRNNNNRPTLNVWKW